MGAHVPGIERAAVASGFVLRALGGAAATRVPPSGWFLIVCSLGALMVAVSKRRGELAVLGVDAAGHRPVLRWYRCRGLELAARGLAAAMAVRYALRRLSGRHPSRPPRSGAPTAALAPRRALARGPGASARAGGPGRG